MPIGTYGDYTPSGSSRTYQIPTGSSPSHGPENFQVFADSVDEQIVTSGDVKDIVVLTQAAYDALGTPVETTLYVIVG